MAGEQDRVSRTQDHPEQPGSTPAPDLAGLIVQPLIVEDYATICEVWAESGVHFQLTGRESPQNFARQMASGLQTVLGARSEGQVVGVVVITHDGRKGWINRLGVRPSYQRRGVGRALIQAAETLIHAQGLEIVAALVEHHNTASLGLFQSEGYTLESIYYLTKRDRPNA